jgi:hypothetical protein
MVDEKKGNDEDFASFLGRGGGKRSRDRDLLGVGGIDGQGRCSRRLVSPLSIGTSVVVGDTSTRKASPARSVSFVAARGDITAPWDVQNAAVDAWSCMVRTRSESVSCALWSCGRKPGYG